VRKKNSTVNQLESEVDARVDDIKRQAFLMIIENKPEIRLLDVVELAVKIGLDRNITIGDIQGNANSPLAISGIVPPPVKRNQNAKNATPKPLGTTRRVAEGWENHAVKLLIFECLKDRLGSDSEWVSSAVIKDGVKDKIFANTDPKMRGLLDLLSKQRMNKYLREMVRDDKIESSGIRFGRKYRAIGRPDCVRASEEDMQQIRKLVLGFFESQKNIWYSRKDVVFALKNIKRAYGWDKLLNSRYRMNMILSQLTRDGILKSAGNTSGKLYRYM